MKDCRKFAAAILFLCASSVAGFAAGASKESVTVVAPYVVTKVVTEGLPAERGTTFNVSRGVSYKDLDLNTADGRAALEARVQQTAKDVCKELERRHRSAAFAPVAASRACVKDAVNQALAQVRGLESPAERLARNP